MAQACKMCGCLYIQLFVYNYKDSVLFRLCWFSKSRFLYNFEGLIGTHQILLSCFQFYTFKSWWKLNFKILLKIWFRFGPFCRYPSTCTTCISYDRPNCQYHTNTDHTSVSRMVAIITGILALINWMLLLLLFLEAVGRTIFFFFQTLCARSFALPDFLYRDR